MARGTLAALGMFLAVSSAALGKPAATPSPAPTPRQPLRIIGRVHALTTFCRAFQTHFNGAVVPLLAADEQIGYVNYTLGRIEPDYRDRVPEQRLYDDRVTLMAYLKTLFAQIQPAQDEINALRDSAKTATDPQTAQATRDLASQLQHALDRQHQVALDSLSVVRAMSDYAAGTNLTFIPHPFDGPPQGTSLPTPVFPGGYDPQTQRMPESMRDVRTVISLEKQMNRIGDAESRAAVGADVISSNC